MSRYKSRNELSQRRKIAVFGVEPVTEKLGGLGIRQLEISRTLSRHFDIRLLTPFEVTHHKEKFPIKRINYENPETWDSHIQWAEIVYTTHPGVARVVRNMEKFVVIDLLVHEYFEDLEHLPLKKMHSIEKNIFFSDGINRVTEELAFGDFFLSPSERSRDYYLGMLTLMGKLRPQDYPDDPHFKSLIDVVPFGLPNKKPRTGKNLLRGRLPGVGKREFILIWGGTLANWFDCLTPVKAMAILKKDRPHIKLVFIGTTHPVRSEEHEAYRIVHDYSKKKGLLNNNVFFFSDWVPFAQRDYYLTESDAGVVTFQDHIENRFSQRIRLLDYLWGELPTLTNPGNVLSDMIENNSLGSLVPFGDHRALAAAIENLADQPAERRRIKDRIREVKQKLTWQKVVQPLVRFCRNPSRARSIFDEERNPDLVATLNSQSFSADQIIRQLPAHPYLRLTAARKKLDEGRNDEASKLLSQYLRQHGDGLGNPVFRDPLFGQTGIFTVEELECLIPSNRFIPFLRFSLALNSLKLIEAEKILTEEEQLFGESSETLFCRGLLEQRLHRGQKAIDFFEAVAQALPNRYEFCLPLAETLVLLGRFAEARKSFNEVFRRAINCGDEWLRTRSALGVARLGKKPEYQTLQNYFDRDPDNEGMAYALASAQEQAGKMDLARNSFQRCTDSFNDRKLKASAWFRLARLLPESHRSSALKACLELEPSHEGALKLVCERSHSF